MVGEPCEQPFLLVNNAGEQLKLARTVDSQGFRFLVNNVNDFLA